MATPPHRCQDCPIRHSSICGALNDEEHKRLSLLSRRRTVPAHTPIFADGDEAQQYANVVSGIVKLVKTLGDGRQHIIGLLYPPDFLGQPFGSRHTFSAEAETDVELCVFPRQAFLAMLTEYPALERRLLEFVLRELDASRDWNLLLSRKQAFERVASFVLLMARRAPVNGNRAGFTMPMTRAEIADYLGLTLETVSRQMTQLKLKRLIHLPSSREIVVPDMERLAAAAKLEYCGQPAAEAPALIRAAG
jgi:CRP/FNR family transcriptional regulator, anaerobic regulatory protein